MNGGPCQLDLWDYKPKLAEQFFDKDLPDSVRMGQRITTMTSGQARLPGRAVDVQVRAARQVRHVGQRAAAAHRADASTTSRSSKSVHTNAINHDPACTFVMTGSEVPGKPSIGSWLAYGLGSESNDLPAFVVLTPYWSSGSRRRRRSSRACGRAASCPTQVQRRRAAQRRRSGALRAESRRRRARRTAARCSTRSASSTSGRFEQVRRPGDADAHRAVRDGLPHADERAGTDRPLARSRSATLDLYGPDVKKPGSFAAQRAAGPPAGRARRARRADPAPRLGPARQPAAATSRSQCKDTDQPTAALLTDLKQRGLLDSTLVVWGGEFGRTVYSARAR